MQANSEVVSRAQLPEGKNRGPCLVLVQLCAKYRVLTISAER